MTVPTMIDASAFADKYLTGPDGDHDLARVMLEAFAEALMSAQASAMCDAGYGERTEERTNSRNGYRHRDWDTRVGTIDLAIPKWRASFPTGRWAAGGAGVGVGGRPGVPRGCATRSMTGAGDGHRGDLEVAGVAHGRGARCRVAEPLDGGPYRYLWIDALTQRVREGGRVVNCSVVVATVVTCGGHREVAGFDIVTTSRPRRDPRDRAGARRGGAAPTSWRTSPGVSQGARYLGPAGTSSQLTQAGFVDVACYSSTPPMTSWRSPPTREHWRDPVARNGSTRDPPRTDSGSSPPPSSALCSPSRPTSGPPPSATCPPSPRPRPPHPPASPTSTRPQPQTAWGGGGLTG